MKNLSAGRCHRKKLYSQTHDTGNSQYGINVDFSFTRAPHAATFKYNKMTRADSNGYSTDSSPETSEHFFNVLAPDYKKRFYTEYTEKIVCLG